LIKKINGFSCYQYRPIFLRNALWGESNFTDLTKFGYSRFLIPPRAGIRIDLKTWLIHHFIFETRAGVLLSHNTLNPLVQVSPHFQFKTKGNLHHKFILI
jgi:hypothetical protein